MIDKQALDAGLQGLDRGKIVSFSKEIAPVKMERKWTRR
jgi:hypothetical protein